MIVWTPAVLSVLYACALCFGSTHLSMFHMERRFRNTLIIVIIIIIICDVFSSHPIFWDIKLQFC